MQLAELNWPQVEALSPDTPIVFPVAALEQHGLHLPLFTDSMLLGEIVRRVASSFTDRVVFAPLMWLGNSDHHLDFPGTLSAPPRVYLDLLNGMVENFIQHGFRRLVILNGHGGNDVPGRQAIFEIRQRHRSRDDLLLLFATYWNLAPVSLDETFTQREMGHACEWETSMILSLAPQLVQPCKDLEPVAATMPFEPAVRGWITRDRTVPGHIGCPAAASAEKGSRLFEEFSRGVSALLERILQWDGKGWKE